METILAILGVLGLGALITSAYVFTVAARNFVSEDDYEDDEHQLHSVPSPERPMVPRSRTDRRQHPSPKLFPITVNGELIPEDRRKMPDRRRAAG